MKTNIMPFSHSKTNKSSIDLSQTCFYNMIRRQCWFIKQTIIRVVLQLIHQKWENMRRHARWSLSPIRCEWSRVKWWSQYPALNIPYHLLAYPRQIWRTRSSLPGYSSAQRTGGKRRGKWEKKSVWPLIAYVQGQQLISTMIWTQLYTGI